MFPDPGIFVYAAYEALCCRSDPQRFDYPEITEWIGADALGSLP